MVLLFSALGESSQVYLKILKMKDLIDMHMHEAGPADITLFSQLFKTLEDKMNTKNIAVILEKKFRWTF
jgi:hypothetical protein